MAIYEGIQLIYAHVHQLFNSISNWFQGIEWNVLIEQFPLQFQAPISACILILLALAGVGIIKKLSFLLG